MTWKDALAAVGWSLFSAAVTYLLFKWSDHVNPWPAALGTFIGVMIKEAWGIFRRRQATLGL